MGSPAFVLCSSYLFSCLGVHFFSATTTEVALCGRLLCSLCFCCGFLCWGGRCCGRAVFVCRVFVFEARVDFTTTHTHGKREREVCPFLIPQGYFQKILTHTRSHLHIRPSSKDPGPWASSPCLGRGKGGQKSKGRGNSRRPVVGGRSLVRVVCVLRVYGAVSLPVVAQPCQNFKIYRKLSARIRGTLDSKAGNLCDPVRKVHHF